MDTIKKRISCRRCQLRKLKCTRIDPCENCLQSGSDCSFRDDDVRRRPVNRAYVAALEERIASYEATIRTLQRQPTETSVASTSPMVSKETSLAPELVFDYSGSSRVSTLTLQPSPQGHRSFYGPMGIYQKGCFKEPCHDGGGEHNDGDGPSFPFRTVNDVHVSGIFQLDRAFLQTSISLFLRHITAECPFINSTSLFDDLTRGEDIEQRWSYPLVYTACCLGARLSAEPHVVQAGNALQLSAHKLLSLKRLQSPSLSTIQALTCLSLYEFGAGNNTKGWLLSGMAFRMVQDMGLHQDPKFLVKDDESISHEEYSQVRRNVYWGCYIFDKIISLYLGRAVCLRDEDASVDRLGVTHDFRTAPAQNISSCEYGQHLPPFSLEIGRPSCIVLPHLMHLGIIIEAVMAELFSTKLIKLPRKELVTHRVSKLEEMNVRLFKWHSSLPEALAWNQWVPTTEKLAPQLTVLHAFYHSCVISLNRHFIKPTPGFARKSQSSEICMTSAESIMSMVRQYRAQHSLEKAPLILVYSLAMASTAITFAFDGSVVSGGPPPELSQHMRFIHKALRECAKSYPSAMHIGAKLKGGCSNGDITCDEDNTASLSSRAAGIVEQGQVEGANGGILLNAIGVEVIGSDAMQLNTRFGVTEDALWYPQSQTMPFADDQEGDAVDNFDWSNVFV